MRTDFLIRPLHADGLGNPSYRQYAMNDDWFILFSLVFARVGGLTMTAPIYGTGDVPLQVRVLLAAALALLVAPLQCSATAVHFRGPLDYGMLLGCEAAIGACLGLGLLVFLHGMTLAGQLVGQASGLGIAEVFDPALDENVPLFSRLLFLLAVTVFLCLGGHRMVMAGLLDTFRAIPPGSASPPASLADGFVALVSLSFSLAIRVAAPAVTALLLATLILGLIGRTLPQLNVLALGFGLNALLTFAAVALSLGAAAWAFQDQIQPAMEAIFDALKTPLRMEWMS
jgi:flagellar biosynthesis protein FliR